MSKLYQPELIVEDLAQAFGLTDVGKLRVREILTKHNVYKALFLYSAGAVANAQNNQPEHR